MLAINLNRKGPTAHANDRGWRLDLHRSRGAARDIAGDDRQRSPSHIRQHRTLEIVRIEPEFVELDLAVGARRKYRVVDEGDTDTAIRAGLDEILFEQRIPDFGWQTLACAQDRHLPSQLLYLRDPRSFRGNCGTPGCEQQEGGQR